jgi:hypothetical protein
MKNIVVFLLFICLLPSAALSAGIEHQLSVRIGFFDAARVKMNYDIIGNKYNFSSAVATAGTFGDLYEFNASYSSSGIFKKDKVITQDYNYVTKNKSHTRTKQLVFDKNGVISHRLSTKDGEPKRVDITPPQTPFDAYDMQTVFAVLTRQIISSQFCAMEKVIFDGKKTYKITISDEGKETLNDPEITFNGEALKCSMHITALDDEDDNDLLWSTTADRPVYFWILHDKKSGLPYLTKIEIKSTPLGKLKAYTTAIVAKD